MNMGKLAWGLPCILLAWGTAPAEQTLFVNGVVWTADPALPQAEAVLVDGGRIEYVGTAEAAAERAAQDAEVIDLSGGMLLPGFIETHSHPAVAGLLNSKLQVIGTRTTAEVQAALRAYADTHADEEVLFGFGFPSALNTAVNAAGVQGPYREDLDAVVSDRPVMLIALDAHSAWVNSKALEVAGITRETPDPLPGVHYYQRDENGEPTGWMVEGNAFWPLVPLFGIGSEDDFRAAFSAMLPRYAAMGITTVFDAGIPGGDALLRNALQALAAMEGEGRLPVRFRASSYLNSPDEIDAGLAQRLAGIRQDFASDLIDLRTVKIPNDGTIEGETAAVLEPYASGGRGAVLLSGEPFARLLAILREADWDAHIHAIGDRTLNVTLEAVAAARQAVPEADSRVTVAHAMLAAPRDLARLRALDVAIQTTPHWAHDLGGTLGLYSRLLDEERGARVMLLKDLWEAAPRVAFGADYPATGLPFPQTSPLHGIEIGHTRREPGATEGPPLPPADQRMALDDMLRGYTANAARQLRLEREVGVIAPGMQADLVVLGRNLLREPPHRIHAIPVELTMMGGRIVFARDPAVAQTAPSSSLAGSACVSGGEVLDLGFYSDFRPVSYGEDTSSDGRGRTIHMGFEADLLTALEALEDSGLSFRRRDIGVWEGDWLGVPGGIWLRSATQYDIVGGGITILDSREKNAAGETVVRFTSGHIAFRQSLLVRAEDAQRLADYASLTRDVRVGVVAGTTGEARLLQLTELTDDGGVLAAGTRVETPEGAVVADGSTDYRIDAAGETANLLGRQRLHPPDPAHPQVIYFNGETELLPALGAGEIDAVARGEIGNADAAFDSAGAFVIAAIDSAAEYGGFTVAADKPDLLTCLNERISWLTDERRIGYAEWREDSGVFLDRARTWNRLAAGSRQDAAGADP